MSKEKGNKLKPSGQGSQSGKPDLDAGAIGIPKNGAADTGTASPRNVEKVYANDKAIAMERWLQAQKAEREQHTMSPIEGMIHYGKAYRHYFKFVGLGQDLHGLNVIEVGPADFPALAHCKNWGTAIIVEPMPSEILENTCKEQNITLVTKPFEDCIPLDFGAWEGTTEVWLFNVLQHVIDPNLFIGVAKTFADRIRFFEPIDQPITEYHPHSYSLKDFQSWFGQVNLYAGKSVEGFHEADCVYGLWQKE